MSKHTPGPWTMSGGRSRITDTKTTFHFVGPDKIWIAAVPYSDKTTEEHLASLADARLIAAAPDLYEALKEAEQFISNGIELGYITMPPTDSRDRALKVPGIIQAALAKAEGKEG